MNFSIRLAETKDLPALQVLIDASVRQLSKGYYTDSQIESALIYIFGVDTQLLEDKTYYVAETEEGTLIACGGWSKRQALFGGDQYKGQADPFLDPAKDAARIRAFFVHPDWARKGIGRSLIRLCEAAALADGFHSMELGATLPGVPLYISLGYENSPPIQVLMPNGEHLPIVKMYKDLTR